MLNLPKMFKESKSVLIAGMGGGWDFMGGIPIAKSLPGRKIIFANYSAMCSDYVCELAPISPYDLGKVKSYPEYYVSQFLGYPLYVIGRNGSQLVQKALKKLIEDHEIDTLIMIDGGVDSLMHGDEEGSGTILEDSITLAATKGITGVKKYLVSLGFGAETEEGVNHYRALENIAQLTKSDGLLGVCAITKRMKCYKHYRKIQRQAIERGASPSHIHTKVMAAVEGQFGSKDLVYDTRLFQSTGEVFINPLMGLYWWFDLEKVVENNLFVTLLEKTNTYIDAKMILRQNINIMGQRKNMTIPL